MSELLSNQMKVTVLDREYHVACPEGQEDNLVEAADLLDQRMRGTQNVGSNLSREQMATITALNLAHELLEQRRTQQRQLQKNNVEIHDHLQAIKSRLDSGISQRRINAGQLHQF